MRITTWMRHELERHETEYLDIDGSVTRTQLAEAYLFTHPKCDEDQVFEAAHVVATEYERRLPGGHRLH